MLKEIIASLAMENINLNQEQKSLLEAYAKGTISFEELKKILLKPAQKNEAA